VGVASTAEKREKEEKGKAWNKVLSARSPLWGAWPTPSKGREGGGSQSWLGGMYAMAGPTVGPREEERKKKGKRKRREECSSVHHLPAAGIYGRRRGEKEKKKKKKKKRRGPMADYTVYPSRTVEGKKKERGEGDVIP